MSQIAKDGHKIYYRLTSPSIQILFLLLYVTHKRIKIYRGIASLWRAKAKKFYQSSVAKQYYPMYPKYHHQQQYPDYANNTNNNILVITTSAPVEKISKLSASQPYNSCLIGNRLGQMLIEIIIVSHSRKPSGEQVLDQV